MKQLRDTKHDQLTDAEYDRQYLVALHEDYIEAMKAQYATGAISLDEFTAEADLSLRRLDKLNAS